MDTCIYHHEIRYDRRGRGWKPLGGLSYCFGAVTAINPSNKEGKYWYAVYVGVARCSWRDMFSRRYGRSLTYQRVLDDFTNGEIPVDVLCFKEKPSLADINREMRLTLRWFCYNKLPDKYEQESSKAVHAAFLEGYECQKKEDFNKENDRRMVREDHWRSFYQQYVSAMRMTYRPKGGVNL